MRKIADYLKSYHKFSIDCEMSAEKAAEALESELCSDNSTGFNGKRDGLRFRLTYVYAPGRSSFRPYINVKIVENGCGRCCVNVTEDLYPSVKLFAALWEVPLVLLLLLMIPAALIGAVKPLWIAFLLPFAAMGYLLTVISFNMDAVPAKDRLYTLFKARENNGTLDT